MRYKTTGSPSFLASGTIEADMFPVLPLYVLLPSGAIASVPPSLTMRMHFKIAETSFVPLIIGTGAAR